MLHGTERQKLFGDDDGCFSHALWAVRTFGGILEHPEASHAWKFYGLNKPPRHGGWVKADEYGGWTTCVAQGHYGHRARKLTWLYGVGINRKLLNWSPCEGKDLLEDGFHSKEERARLVKTGICQRLSKRQRAETPVEFQRLLVSILE